MTRTHTIANALRAKTAEEIAAAKRRIQELYEKRGEEIDEWDDGQVDEGDENEEAACDETDQAVPCAAESAAEPQRNSSNGEGDHSLSLLIERSRRLFDQMHPDDREEAIELHDKIEMAIAARDDTAASSAARSLEELLFFIEGQR
jgi:hypothetical protein